MYITETLLSIKELKMQLKEAMNSSEPEDEQLARDIFGRLINLYSTLDLEALIEATDRRAFERKDIA